jgi:hypothetical protein
LKIVILNEDGTALSGYTFGYAPGGVKNWDISGYADFRPTYTATLNGINDMSLSYGGGGGIPKKHKINFYERGSALPSKFKIVTFN